METCVETCLYCGESVEPRDRNRRTGDFRGVVHHECLVRMTVGSVGHQLRRCRCFGGTEEDAPGVSLRQGAREAAAMYVVLTSIRAPGRPRGPSD